MIARERAQAAAATSPGRMSDVGLLALEAVAGGAAEGDWGPARAEAIRRLINQIDGTTRGRIALIIRAALEGEQIPLPDRRAWGDLAGMLRWRAAG